MNTDVETTGVPPSAMTDDAAPPSYALDRSTLTQQVRVQVEARIRSGELSPGARVPSERALSSQFQVARTSVREAMQGLVALGLIERRGNRSYVVGRLPGVVLEEDERKAFVRQLFETRRVLELPILERAACRASADDRVQIAEIAEEFERTLSLPEFRRLDRHFHTRTAAAAGNTLLLEVYGKVLDHLFRSEAFESLLFASENQSEVQEIVRESSHDHIAIADAIIAGDPVDVMAAAQRHLANVEARILHDLN